MRRRPARRLDRLLALAHRALQLDLETRDPRGEGLLLLHVAHELLTGTVALQGGNRDGLLQIRLAGSGGGQPLIHLGCPRRGLRQLFRRLLELAADLGDLGLQRLDLVGHLAQLREAHSDLRHDAVGVDRLRGELLLAGACRLQLDPERLDLLDQLIDTGLHRRAARGVRRRLGRETGAPGLQLRDAHREAAFALDGLTQLGVERRGHLVDLLGVEEGELRSSLELGLQLPGACGQCLRGGRRLGELGPDRHEVGLGLSKGCFQFTASI